MDDVATVYDCLEINTAILTKADKQEYHPIETIMAGLRVVLLYQSQVEAFQVEGFQARRCGGLHGLLYRC